MTVDIRGTNSFNYGAQLMLRAAAEALGPYFELSAPPQMSEFGVRARLGLKQTLVLNQLPWMSLRAGNLVPAPVVQALGLARHRDVNGVVDASGFAYSDSFGRRRIRREAIYAQAWRARGVPVIRLPQAFGPFQDPSKRDWARRVVDNSSLVYARDRVSRDHVAGLGSETEVLLCPDFTVPLHAPELDDISDEPFLAIVPNHKLVVSGIASESGYVRTLSDYASVARREGLKPILLLHDDHDRGIVEGVQSMQTEGEIEVFTDPDPLVLKAALGQAEYVVSSRFHAIVSALSGGVPTLALGWSHKYEELLRDFDSPHWIIGADDAAAAGFELLRADSRAVSEERLTRARARIVAHVDMMWDRVRTELRSAAA